MEKPSSVISILTRAVLGTIALNVTENNWLWKRKVATVATYRHRCQLALPASLDD